MLKYGYLYWYCHTKTLLSWLPQIGFKRILIKSKAYILKFINKLVEKFGPDLLLLFFLLSGYLPVTLKLSAFFPHVHLHKPIGLSESFVTSYLAVFVYIFSVQIYFRSVGQYFRVSYLRQPSCCSSHSWKKKKKVSDFLWPHGLQHTRLPCPSPSLRACLNSCPLSWWCHPAISSSVISFSSCLQSFPALGSFPMSQLFISGGQSTGASASASVPPMNVQYWFPLELTGLISRQSKGLPRVFSKSTVQKHQFFSTQPSLWLLETP